MKKVINYLSFVLVLVLTFTAFSCGGDSADSKVVTATIIANSGTTIGTGETGNVSLTFSIKLKNATFRSKRDESSGKVALVSEDGKTSIVIGGKGIINDWIKPNTYGLNFLFNSPMPADSLDFDTIVVVARGVATTTSTENVTISIPTTFIKTNDGIPVPTETSITAGGKKLKYNIKYEEPSANIIVLDGASNLVKGEIKKTVSYKFSIKISNGTIDTSRLTKTSSSSGAEQYNMGDRFEPVLAGMRILGSVNDSMDTMDVSVSGEPTTKNRESIRIKNFPVIDVNKNEKTLNITNTGLAYQIIDPSETIDASDLFVTLYNNTFTAPDVTDGFEAWAILINDTTEDIQKPTVPTLNNILESTTLTLMNPSCNNNAPREIHRPYTPYIVDEALLEKSRNTSKEGIARDVTKTNSSYNVGDKEKFWVNSTDGNVSGYGGKYKQVTATLKAKNGPVKVSDGSNRYVLVWADDSLKNVSNDRYGIPTDEEYKKIADIFLTDGTNDIYGIVTSTFGSDIGKYNGTKDGALEGFADDLEAINILYTDINGVGLITDGVSYTGGFYGSSDYFPGGTDGWSFGQEESSKTNSRPMFYMHAYAAGNKRFGSALTTLAHEFQHLVHDQWFNSNLGFRKGGIGNSFITETFASAAEDLTAEFIHRKTGQDVPDPFYVGYGGNEKGYLEDDNSNTYKNAISNGRGPFALSTFNVNGNMRDRLKLNSNYTWNNQLWDYGKDATLAHYLVVNYGKKFFQEYQTLYSDYKNKDDLSSVVTAINNISGTSYTIDDFLKNYGSALILSRVDNNGKGLSVPYSFNKKAYYNVDGLNVPSVNLWQYEEYTNSSVIGFKSYSWTTLFPYSTNFVKLLDNVQSGNNTISGFTPGSVKYQVVLVPKTAR